MADFYVQNNEASINKTPRSLAAVSGGVGIVIAADWWLSLVMPSRSLADIFDSVGIVIAADSRLSPAMTPRSLADISDGVGIDKGDTEVDRGDLLPVTQNGGTSVNMAGQNYGTSGNLAGQTRC